jgi:hypothetical protein
LLGPKDKLLAALPDTTTLVDWRALIQQLCSAFQLAPSHHSTIAAMDGALPTPRTA